jgi:dihydroneopterin aldolase
MANCDLISIHDWELDCLIGLYPHERRQPRRVVIDLTLALEPRQRNDDISATIDYDQLQQAILQEIKASSHQLIETLAEEIAAVALRHPLAKYAVVTVGKPGALPATRTVTVTITRFPQEAPR